MVNTPLDNQIIANARCSCSILDCFFNLVPNEVVLMKMVSWVVQEVKLFLDGRQSIIRLDRVGVLTGWRWRWRVLPLILILRCGSGNSDNLLSLLLHFFHHKVHYLVYEGPASMVVVDIGMNNTKSFDEHIEHIKCVFAVLSKEHLYANLAKCIFCTDKVVFPGFVVSGQGVSSIAAPINKLTKKKVSLHCGEVQGMTFHDLKMKLTTTVLLALLDFGKTYEIELDESGVGIRGMCRQERKIYCIF
uniref:Uncharacterized protein n=1 Tax=Oryza brachyantha TaxID=4533 RepID=J3N7L7_ORYBR